MVLKFNCKRDGRCYVFDENQEVQYVVKCTHDPQLSGGVYDDLGLSCLIGIEEEAEGYSISAFDTPLGVFETGIGDVLYKMQGEGWEITKNSNEYFLARSGENLATITVNGTEAIIDTEVGGQIIVVIAAAIIAIEHQKTLGVKLNPVPKKVERTQEIKQKTTAENTPIISINWVALKALFKKEKLKKVGGAVVKVIPSVRFKVTGVALIACVTAIAICLCAFITGLVITAKSKSVEMGTEWTEAEVNINKATGVMTADYTPPGTSIEYRTELKGYEEDYKDGQKIILYYTRDEKGNIKDIYSEKPEPKNYIPLSIWSLVVAVLVFVFMFIGNPMQYKKMQELKKYIKNLRPVPQETDETQRYVETDAYVTPAEEETGDSLFDTTDNTEE